MSSVPIRVGGPFGVGNVTTVERAARAQLVSRIFESPADEGEMVMRSELFRCMRACRMLFEILPFTQDLVPWKVLEGKRQLWNSRLTFFPPRPNTWSNLKMGDEITNKIAWVSSSLYLSLVSSVFDFSSPLIHFCLRGSLKIPANSHFYLSKWLTIRLAAATMNAGHCNVFWPDVAKAKDDLVGAGLWKSFGLSFESWPGIEAAQTSLTSTFSSQFFYLCSLLSSVSSQLEILASGRDVVFSQFGPRDS